MSIPTRPESLYLSCVPDPVFATVHRPAQPRCDTAVVICPPFGWDEVCSYRSLRRWGERLADDGHAALRLSLPGTGDSGGGPHDPDRVGAWVSATTSAAEWLRAETGARRLAVLGIGLGGLLACLAIADGAPIDDLVLWGVPARGRAFMRQLRAFSRLEQSRFYEGREPPPSLPGQVEAGGFVMSAETVARLEAIDIGQLELGPGPGRRALLLERDGIPPDPGLREALERAGLAIVAAPGPGFADMTSHPQLARPPVAVFDHVGRWLDAAAAPGGQLGPRPGARHAGSTPAAREVSATATAAIQADAAGTSVSEAPIWISLAQGRLSGIRVAPLEASESGLCVVLLNAGAVRRIGPSRLWVEAARRWAAQGVTTVRLDCEAIGESDGDEAPYRDDGALYTPRFVPQVLEVLDSLQAAGVGERFVLGGLCAGAYWSFHALLRDDRVCGSMLVNPGALVWRPDLGPARDLRALLSQPFSLSRIRRVGAPQRRAFLRWLSGAPVRWLRRLWTRHSPEAVAEARLDSALAALVASRKPTLLLFSEREPVYDELVRSGHLVRLTDAANVTFERVAVRDHTMRPSWAQRQAHEALDRALEQSGVEARAVAAPAEADPRQVSA